MLTLTPAMSYDLTKLWAGEKRKKEQPTWFTINKGKAIMITVSWQKYLLTNRITEWNIVFYYKNNINNSHICSWYLSTGGEWKGAMTEKEKLVLFDNFTDKYQIQPWRIIIFFQHCLCRQPGWDQWTIHLIIVRGDTIFYNDIFQPLMEIYILTRGRGAPHSATVAVIGRGYG